MSLWTAAGAAAATGGTASRDWQATGVSIDSRTVQPGDLFVALSDRRDGHDFVAAALAAGAAAAMVSRRPPDVAADAPLLVVPDVLAGLAALGRAGRARARARVIAVTGSVGKTSTKEMLRTVLAPLGRVHAAEASYNNHWGVPLTLARLPQDADFAVIEIGTNHPGEIAPLARMAAPHVAIVVNVASAHLEFFGSLEAIAHEKAAIFSGLVPGGAAVINADLATTPILEAAAREARARIVRFGEVPGADVRLGDIRVAGGCTVIAGEIAGAPILYKFRSPGRHHAANSAGVLACLMALGLDPAAGARDLAGWEPLAGRGLREEIVLDPAHDDLTFTLIDDAFNANPDSMAAALTMLAEAPVQDAQGRRARGRRIAILGDMLELGPDEDALHAGLAALPAMAAIDRVHCVGRRMKALHGALPPQQQGEWHETAADLAPRVRTLVHAGDVVLVKGSKGSSVSLVAARLRQPGGARFDMADG